MITARSVYRGVIQLALAGQADLATVEPLREAVTRAVHSEHVVGVLIDLCALRYLDSTTIAVLVDGRRLADARGIGYQVVNPEGIVRQVLEVGGVPDYLRGEPAG